LNRTLYIANVHMLLFFVCSRASRINELHKGLTPQTLAEALQPKGNQTNQNQTSARNFCSTNVITDVIGM
jgi:hypothetical protein